MLQKGGDDSDQIDLKNLSPVERENLRTLVKELFNILPKTEAGSPGQLRKLLGEKSILTQMRDGFDEHFIYSQVTESAMELIGAAFHTLLQRDEMQRQFYNFLTVANTVYQNGDPVSPEEYSAKEEGVRRILDHILNVAIGKSIEETFDWDRTKESQVAAKFTTEMSAIASKLEAGLRKNHRKLIELAREEGSDLPDHPKVAHLLTVMLTLQQEATQKLAKIRSDIQGSKDLSNSQAHLLKTCKELHNRLMAIGRPVVAIHKPKAHMAFWREVSTSVRSLSQGFDELDAIFSRSAWKKGVKEIGRLKVIVTNLKEQPEIHSSCTQLESLLNKAKEKAEGAGEKAEAIRTLRVRLKRPDSSSEDHTFGLWYQALQTAVTRKEQQDMKMHYAQLLTVVSEFPCTTEQRAALMKQLDVLKRARSDRERREGLEKWQKELAAVEGSMTEQIERTRTKLDKEMEKSRKVFTEMETLGSPGLPAATFNDVGVALGDFRTWLDSDGIRAPTLKPSRIPCKNLVARSTRHVVFNAVKKKVEALYKLKHKRYFWRDGLIHHNLFLPFLADKS